MKYDEICKILPKEIGDVVNKYLNDDVIQEIRIKVGKPIILNLSYGEKILEYKTKVEDLKFMMAKISNYSLYAFEEEIKQGYITLKGGHRIGISGSVVQTDGKITKINYISNLNFRIARQIIGASNEILRYIINMEENSIYNTLIASSPGAGKTTILRDVVRRLSDGIDQINFKGKTISLVDERGEIAAVYKGVPQNDIGVRTDVMDNVDKSIGMRLLIRSMSPEIIVADEIGKDEDVEAINYAVCSGIKGIFTAHGGSLKELQLNPAISKIIDKHIFERIIFLDKTIKGKVKTVYALDKINNEYVTI